MLDAVSNIYPPLKPALAHLSAWATSLKLSTSSVLVLVFLSTLSLFVYSNEKWRSLRSAWSFISERHDFVTSHLAETGGRPFVFKALQHTVTTFSGQSARQMVFSDQALDPNAAQRVLGILPQFNMKEFDMEKQAKGQHNFGKRLLLLAHRDRVAEALPGLLDDLWSGSKDWGNEGAFDPFIEMHDLIFQMTIRVASCREIYQDRKTVMELEKSFLNLETTATPFSILFPWFPGPSQLGRLKSVLSIIKKFQHAVRQRRNASNPSNDGIDALIAEGDTDQFIAGTVMGFMLAGTVNTGVMAAWALLYLGSHPEWKQRAIDDFKRLLNKHSDSITSNPLHKRLSSISLKAWEEELPSVDLIIRETIRLIMCGSAIRRNVARDIVIDGVRIKKGDFATYSIADAHLNPDIYTNPMKFDPERYLPGREEDRKENFAYIGWGAGRHPCLGMKLATLELKLVLATMLLGFEWELVDCSGSYPEAIPVPDRNNNHSVRYVGDPCYLKFKRV